MCFKVHLPVQRSRTYTICSQNILLSNIDNLQIPLQISCAIFISIKAKIGSTRDATTGVTHEGRMKGHKHPPKDITNIF